MNQIQNRYHTNFIALFKADLLNPADYRAVPSSTKSNWRSRDLTTLIGSEFASALENRKELYIAMSKYQKLERLHIALHKIYVCLTTILNSIKSKNKLFRIHKNMILDIIQKVMPDIGLTPTLEYLQISYNQYHSWKNAIACPKSIFSLCRNRHTLQLSLGEVKTIKQYLLNPRYKDWSMASVWCKAIRDDALHVGRTTFYHYARKLNLSRRKRKKIDSKRRIGIRAKEPLEILHMDVTIFRTVDRTRVYIYFIQDNFSRVILGWKASLKLSASLACENLKEVCDKYLSKNAKLITDGGPENAGELKEFTVDPNNLVKQLIAQKDIYFSNSMVEAANKRIKYDYLFTSPIYDFSALVRHLEECIPLYNQKPLVSLNTLTPNEVLQGLSREKDFYSVILEQARYARLRENQQFNCLLKC